MQSIGVYKNYSKTSESLWQYCRDQPDDDHRPVTF